jgi:glyoxylase-like metal-dependent hydrolase (beta-lactamase superfamily II)
MRRLSHRLALLLLTLVVPFGAVASAQDDWESVQIETVSVRDGLYMLVGRGGNIGLSVGDEGTFLIDDQYAPLTPKIEAAIRKVTPVPVRFLVNTHWHGDHTGGNENFGKAGSILVAHENVRRRMSVEQVREILKADPVPASPRDALPRITFTEEVTFHWNGDDIRAFHVAPAHTDGDVMIHFPKADVLHTGDVIVNGRYPFIDVDSGGNLNGIIAAAERVLALVKPTTKIIPGHGALAGPDDVRAYRDMLVLVRDRVQKLVDQGKSVDEVVAAKPTADLDSKWGAQPERFVRGAYHSLRAR